MRGRGLFEKSMYPRIGVIGLTCGLRCVYVRSCPSFHLSLWQVFCWCLHVLLHLGCSRRGLQALVFYRRSTVNVLKVYCRRLRLRCDVGGQSGDDGCDDRTGLTTSIVRIF